MKKKLAAAIVGLVTCASCIAWAGETIRAGLVGTWKLVVVYDQFTDGTKRETWGPAPQGLLVFTPEGMFSAIIVAGDRAARPNTVPTDPVGPAIAYFGSFSVDEAAGTFATKVSQSTFPPWQGVTQMRKVEELGADRLKVVASPITDPSGRQYVPHLEFERVR
ncbi:hypothetical protein TSH100_22040 [Azospirillum sp. TSH100]|uniref:lipocalin-like domain-containing protein n=1 Tax=Azospirillum sp. TSH100 TaxID=652764 RepID=UPI000D617975|nr:lipocalin-like domain-containing protein [Azospirillum sp. TSH100]PWC83069.1 hypothetical protein TSH100_22040 [Azospirillum sp. TSH100]QCG89923.1 lipocalin-like domain-containing protein [Azospirillum sp. TSH100]